ncbi:MAG: 50S ribosomal protein L10 [Anaerolineae bacterium]
MAISREKKEKIVADLVEKFSRSQALIMTDYRGLKVEEMRTLRNRLREESCGYHVVKNSLVKLAMEKAGLPFEETLFAGPTAIGFCYEDVVAPAKALVNYAKETKTLAIRGGLMGSRMVNAGEIISLSQLPSRDEILAQMIAQLQAPLVGLVSILSDSLRALIYLLQARAEQMEPQG